MFISEKNTKSFSFRTYRNLKAWYVNNKRFNKLTLGHRRSSGYDSKGHIAVHTKGSVKSKIIHNIMCMTFKGFLALTFLVQIKFDNRRSGMVGLFSNSFGCWFHSLLPSNFFLFDYLKIYNSALNKKYNLVTNFWPKILSDMPLHSRICSLEIIDNNYISKGVKFIRSAGSRGLLLDNKYKFKYTIIILPSFQVKIICSNSAAFLNYIENELSKYLKVKKAGYYVNKGRKPTVRGIVKNPCDHPNGGRARTVLLSRTPWGKVAKKSRKRSDVINLRELSKRSSSKSNIKSPDSLNSIIDIINNQISIKHTPKSITDYLSTVKL